MREQLLKMEQKVVIKRAAMLCLAADALQNQLQKLYVEQALTVVSRSR
jgi:hypothetical protein